MKKVAALSALCILLLVACSAPAPPPPAQENLPPPEPTPEEIAAKIRPILQPLEALVTEGKGGVSILSKEARNKFVADVKVAKQQNQGSENGKQALKMITHDIETIIQKARDQERFLLVLGALAGYQELETLGVTMKRLQERATLEVTRPYLTVHGFFDDKATGETYVFIDVNLVNDNLELSKDAISVRARKGDEFYNCRLVDFIGDKKGCTFEYLKIPGKTWNRLTQ